ncbi:MAG: acetyl-CoA C-acyltransferase [Deltaproteobacteria bacterium]|nr:acetyl-CoA C-acyltransferase [Deltaproteobacteria bacterium]MCW5805328.1 acetyl-CoA C-acyltransferase [Deltaproteobacteria bacterium]
MRDVVIVGAARTAIGSFLGSLASVAAPRLGATSIQAALERAGVAPGDVQLVHMGMVLPAGVGQAPARQAALYADLPKSVPCVTINKVCGSGLEAVLGAARMIAAGDIDVAVAGGMESMSNTPHVVRGLRNGVKMGALDTVDTMITDGLWDPYNNQHMGNCAELCAKEKGIPRSAQDEHAAESYRRALDAQKQGHFKAEIAAVKIADRKGEISIDVDEEPGRGSIDKLPGLRTAFQKDGTITAGNASSINDGGAAVVLMSADEAKRRGAKVLARLVASGYHAQAPEWFTTAPATAIQNALKKASWDAKKVDLWEINEAFSVVSIANNQLLGLDAAKVNVWGGAVALGHPIGASGARVLVTLLHAMAARGAKTGGASLCIGGGEGIALLVERP